MKVAGLHAGKLGFRPAFAWGDPPTMAGAPLGRVQVFLVVERVDVHARLGKRLAALLGDLAEHKRMSLGSCLEEFLLPRTTA